MGRLKTRCGGGSRWRVSLLLLAGLLLAGAGCQREQPPDLRLEEHIRRHPDLTAEDLYKYVQHATMGSAHFGGDRTLALRYLEMELAALGSPWEGDTVLVEELGHGWARVHLHPYLRAGGDPERLVDAFVRSSRIPPDTAAFLAAWHSLLRRAEADTGLPAARLQQLDSLGRAEDWPALHHSDRFREAYRPHYRVVELERARTLRAELPHR